MRTIRFLKTHGTRLLKASATEATILALMAGPAFAQRATNGGGGDAPFAEGVTTGLTWVHYGAAAIAIVAFIIGCILLFMRQIMGAAGAFFFVIIGGALLANADTILTRLTTLTFS